MDLAALTLHIGYSENQVRVKEVHSSLKGLLTRVSDGMINAAWSEVEPVTIPENGTLLTLVLETTSDLNGNTDIFSLSSQSEFADANGDKIDNANLKISRIDNTTEYGINVYPNPVKDESTIQYTLPGTARVNLTILDQYGKTIATLKDKEEDAGNYTVKFIPADYNLANGVYFCRIQADSPKGNFRKTVKLIYIR